MIFSDGERFLGKVVLTEVSPAEFRLFAKPAQGFGWWINAVAGDDVDFILSAMRSLPTTKGFDEGFGFHKDVSCEGKIRGGGLALWLGGILYLEGFSQAYGPMNRAEVRSALKYISQTKDIFLYELGEQLFDEESNN
jgi:hypothetical protein